MSRSWTTHPTPGNRTAKRLPAVLLISLILAAAGCNASGNAQDAEPDNDGGTSELDAVRLMGPTIAFAGWADILVADEHGMFADHGLDVDVQLAPDSSTSIKLLSSGEVDFAITSPALIVQANEQGADVLAIATTMPHNENGVLVDPELNTTSPADLPNVVLGMPSDPNIAAELDTMAETAGVDKQDLQVVDVALGGLIGAMISGQVDGGYALSFVEVNRYKNQTGNSGDFYKFTDWGVPDMPHYVLATRASYLAKDDGENSEVARRMIKAIEASHEWIPSHLDETVEVLFANREGLSKEDHEFELEGTIQTWQSDYADNHGFGAMDPEVWNDGLAWMEAAGLTSKPDEAASYFTNEYIDGE